MSSPEKSNLEVNFRPNQRRVLLTELQLKEEQARIADQEGRRRQLAEVRLGEPVIFVRGIGYIAASASAETTAVDDETPQIT
jgi:hypothetical protein